MKNQPINCPHCGETNASSQQTYCGFCGCELYSSNSPQLTAIPSVPKNTKKKSEDTGKKLTQKQITEALQQDTKQLRTDIEDLYDYVSQLANTYTSTHNLNPVPWYKQKSSWIAIICGIALLTILFLWLKSQGGMPQEILKLLP